MSMMMMMMMAALLTYVFYQCFIANFLLSFFILQLLNFVILCIFGLLDLLSLEPDNQHQTPYKQRICPYTQDIRTWSPEEIK